MARRVGHGSGHFYVLKTLQAGDITLNERLFPPGYREPRHEHFQPYFSVVLSGEYVERDGPSAQIYRGRCLGFQPVGEHESQVFDKPVRTLVVEFPAATLADVPLRNPFAKEASPAAMCIYGETKSPDSFSSLAIQGLLLELIAESARASTHESSPKWLQRAEELIRLRYAETLTLEQIAKEVGVHPVSLAKAFRKHNRQTVGEAMRRYRVEEAQRLIRTRQGSLAEIAAETGFADQSHLSRVFRRVAGMSPAAYRGALTDS